MVKDFLGRLEMPRIGQNSQALFQIDAIKPILGQLAMLGIG